MSRKCNIFIVVFTISMCCGTCFSSIDKTLYYSDEYSHLHPEEEEEQVAVHANNNSATTGRGNLWGEDHHVVVSHDHSSSNVERVLAEIKKKKKATTTTGAAKSSNNQIINVDHFGAKGNGRDDTKAFLRAWKKACSSSTSKQTTILVPARKKYNLKPITFKGPCKSAITIEIRGSITGSKNLADYRKNTRYWIIFENIKGLTVNGGGTIDGNGQVLWPRHCKIDKTKPCIAGATALTFENCKNLKVTNLNFKNPQRMHLTIDDCSDVEVSKININAPEDSPNTDGIHVSGSRNVRIKNCGIHTGDDCISIVNESYQIVATNIMCGPGHGISIGSLGKNGAKDTVSNIRVSNATIKGADNGVRIKSWQGGKGVAENIIFEDIVMKDVKNPIIIDQFYCDKKGKNCPEKKEAVEIRNVVFKNIRGESATEKGITLKCSSSVPCKSIKMENIKLSYKGGSSLAFCSSAHVLQRGTISPHCP